MSGPRFLWNFMFPYRLIFQWESPGVPTRLLTRDFRKQPPTLCHKKGSRKHLAAAPLYQEFSCEVYQRTMNLTDWALPSASVAVAT